jgi:hypothetical protein
MEFLDKSLSNATLSETLLTTSKQMRYRTYVHSSIKKELTSYEELVKFLTICAITVSVLFIITMVIYLMHVVYKYWKSFKA